MMVGIPLQSSRVHPQHRKDSSNNEIRSTVDAQDLYRLICALSDACESDCNVLRDGNLVDQLEQYAKQIVRSRKERESVPVQSELTQKLSPDIGHEPLCLSVDGVDLDSKVKESSIQSAHFNQEKKKSGISSLYKYDNQQDVLETSVDSTDSSMSEESMSHQQVSEEPAFVDTNEESCERVVAKDLSHTKSTVVHEEDSALEDLTIKDYGLSDTLSIQHPSTALDQDFSLLETFQSQIDLLLEENGRILSENDRLKEVIQMSQSDTEEQTKEKQRLTALIMSQSDRILEMERKLQESEERKNVQESCRRLAEGQFQMGLDAKMQVITSLQQELQSKDEEISRLSQHLKASSSPIESTLFREEELKRLQTTLMEKDREICHLYMNLSCKKQLIQEITKSFNRKQENVDMDVFLFKNVMEKQREMNELTAAVDVMEREVEILEARIVTKTKENNLLKENHDALARSWQTVNAQVCRMQVENERLHATLKEKQS